MSTTPWWRKTLEKRKQNTLTKPKRKSNRDIYNEEIRKLEKLLEKAEGTGTTTDFKPTKAKKITKQHIQSIKSVNRQLRAGKINIPKPPKKKTKSTPKKTPQGAKITKKKQHKQPSQQPSKQKDILPYNEADRLPDNEVLPFGILAEQRFSHYLRELDKAIDLLIKSRRYDETQLLEFRDLITEWYQEDPAEVTQKLLTTLESDGISDYNYFYNLVETGQIALVIYKAQAEHERLTSAYEIERFGILEDEV